MDDLVERLREHFADCPQKSGEKSFTRSLLTEAATRITALEASLAEAEKWRSAVDDALVTSWIGTADSFPDAHTALDKLIEWSMAVAVDPAVSKPAADLVAEAEGRVIAEVVAWLRNEAGDPDDFATYAATALETGEWKKDSPPPPTVV